MLAVSHLAVESHGQHRVGYFSPPHCTNRYRNGPLIDGDCDNQGLFILCRWEVFVQET